MAESGLLSSVVGDGLYNVSCIDIKKQYKGFSATSEALKVHKKRLERQSPQDGEVTAFYY